MLDKLLSSKLLISLVLGLLLMGIIYLEQEFLNKNEANRFDLFTYLKGQFEFILVISHLDVMRDMVDEIIEIQKEGSFSKIKYGV